MANDSGLDPPAHSRAFDRCAYVDGLSPRGELATRRSLRAYNQQVFNASTVLEAVRPFIGRSVSAAYWVGTRQAVGMDGVLHSADAREGRKGRPVVHLEFYDRALGGDEVGWLDVPVGDVAGMTVGSRFGVELDLGGDEVLVLEPWSGTSAA